MVKQGSDSRIAHVGASFELNEVANEVVQVVEVMNGLNRELTLGGGRAKIFPDFSKQ